MFRVALILRGASPFSIFMMEQKRNPALKGISIGERGKMLSKMYKSLTVKERKELQKRAQKHPSMNKKRNNPKRSKPKLPPPTDFSKFVKANYHKVAALNNSRRFSALSQLYQLEKEIPLDMEKELAKLTRQKASGAAAASKKVKSGKKAVKKVAKAAAPKKGK